MCWLPEGCVVVVAVITEVIVDLLIGADDDDTVQKHNYNTLSFGSAGHYKILTLPTTLVW